MDTKQIKYELQHIISGKSYTSHDAVIQTITRYLRTSQRAGPMAQEKHQNKSEETKALIIFASKKQLFYEKKEEDKYISEGAE